MSKEISAVLRFPWEFELAGFHCSLHAMDTSGCLLYQVINGREELLPIMDYTGRLPPERGTLFRLEVYKRVGISRFEVKGWENCQLGIERNFQNISKKMHPTADSSKYFKGFLK